MPKYQISYYATTTVSAVVEIVADDMKDAKRKADAKIEDDGIASLDWEESDGVDRSDIVTEVYLVDDDGNVIEEG